MTLQGLADTGSVWAPAQPRPPCLPAMLLPPACLRLFSTFIHTSVRAPWPLTFAVTPDLVAWLITFPQRPCRHKVQRLATVGAPPHVPHAPPLAGARQTPGG